MLPQKAREILNNPESFGFALSLACDCLTEGMHPAWEFDSLLTFLEDKGCLPEPEARDRLLAVTAIRACPSHLWDHNVFNNLMETLNDRIALTDSLNECSIGELVWGVTEARYVANHYDRRPGDEPYGDDTSMYVAVTLAHNSLVVTPPELAFAVPSLKQITPRSVDFSQLQRDVVKFLSTSSVTTYDEDDPVQVQARMLREAAVYLKTRKDTLRALLADEGLGLAW